MPVDERILVRRLRNDPQGNLHSCDWGAPKTPIGEHSATCNLSQQASR